MHATPTLWTAALLLVALASGCAEENKGRAHPTDRLHYPVSLAADPSGEYLYVVNSNFDVRYRTGSVIAIDLATHELVPGSAAGVGHFGGELALYETGAPERRLVGYLPSRSQGALYWFEIAGGQDGEPPRLTCREEPPTNPNSIAECQRAFRIASAERKRLPQDEAGLTEEEIAAQAGEMLKLSVGLDAFGATIYEGQGGVGDYLLVSNPRSGAVSVFAIGGDVPLDPDEPGQPAPPLEETDFALRSRTGEPVLVESLSLGAGAYGVAVSPDDGMAYATNRSANLIVPFRLKEIPDPDDEPRTWPAAEDMTAFAIANSASLGDYARSLVFSQDGTRGYLAYRNPSSLVVIDTSPGDEGHNGDRFIAAIDLGVGPADIVAAPSGPDGAERLYITCFYDEQIHVVDPATLVVEDIIELPGGPFDATLVHAPALDRFRLYVTAFEYDAVAVVELDRESPFFHQVIAYIRGRDDEGAH